MDLEALGEDNAVPDNAVDPQSNFDLLAAHLKAHSLASMLLAAWKASDTADGHRALVQALRSYQTEAIKNE